MAGVALAAALVAGLLTAPLLRSATQDAVRDPLRRQATVFANFPPQALQAPFITRMTAGGEVRIGVVATDGTVTGAATVLTPTQVRSVLGGDAVSTQGRIEGVDVLIEAQPGRLGGGVVLATDVSALDEARGRLQRRVLLAIVLGMLMATGAAVLVARRIGRPLTETAAAARRLAAGERGVPLPAPRTREVDDVTTALRGLDQALVASEGRQREFLLSVSHELRTPLTALKGYAEALAEGLVGPDEIAQVGRTMTTEADRMQTYVEDLLALARLQADDFSLHLAPTDVADLLHAAAGTWGERATRVGISLTVDAPGGLVVETDPARLRQVVDALVDNALRVCSAGDRVVLGAAPTADGARIAVRDSGPGLTPDDAAVAFEPGVLHDRYADRRPGGHGLGLAIVHRLVTRLGGTIHVDSAPEGGASFVVDLPG